MKEHPEGGLELQQADYFVRMADVDAASVIYFASPLRWQETMVGAWFRGIGHSLSDQLAEGTNCPCVEVRGVYRHPIRLDDPLDLRLIVERVGRSSFGLVMTATNRTGLKAAEVHTVNVSSVVDDDGHVHAVPLPDWLRAALVGPTEP